MLYEVEEWNHVWQGWTLKEGGDLGNQAEIPLSIRLRAGWPSAKWHRGELRERPQPCVVQIYRCPGPAKTREQAGILGRQLLELEAQPKGHIDPVLLVYYARAEDGAAPAMSELIQKVNELVEAVNRLQGTA